MVVNESVATGWLSYIFAVGKESSNLSWHGKMEVKSMMMMNDKDSYNDNIFN